MTLERLRPFERWAGGGPSIPVSPTWPKRGASHYLALGEPTLNVNRYADTLYSLGANFTRMWLCDAWAARGVGETGTYDGFVPVHRTDDGRWDLFDWSRPYFERLRAMTVALNQRGIVPQYTFLELYTWAERKAGSQSHKGMLYVPNQDIGPWRNNITGVCWGWPDDPTFFALPDPWLRSFMALVVEVLDGMVWVAELGNEMPEKPMHLRMAQHLRDVGFAGDITVNRQEDTPGQYKNMQVGGGLINGIAYHGKGTIAWLDEDHPREPEHRTFRHFFEHGRYDANRIIWSGDGVGANKLAPDTYDKPAILEVVDDAKRRGFSIEWQMREVKLERFLNGAFTLATIDTDFTREILR